MKSYRQKGSNALLILNHKTSSKVFIDSVVLIKGNVNYTTFYLNGGRQRVVAHSIKFFENYLETHGFLRVHRAFMINPTYFLAYNSEEESLTMTTGHTVNVSRRKKHTLKKLREGV
jgi:DNA-binding LytR/AlgR family response regulator